MLKTNQIIIRAFYGKEIRQRTEDSYFNATDLLTVYQKKTGDRKDISTFLRVKPTKRFLKALAEDLNNENNNTPTGVLLPEDLYVTKKGKNGGTWMHPYLFIKFAMWINPEFEVKVIRWIHDNLILFRHQAGDHFKAMMDALQKRLISDGIGQNPLVYKEEINFINRLVFGVASVNQRKRASEAQLKRLSALQKANVRLLGKGYDRSVRWERLRDFNEII